MSLDAHPEVSRRHGGLLPELLLPFLNGLLDRGDVAQVHLPRAPRLPGQPGPQGDVPLLAVPPSRSLKYPLASTRRKILQPGSRGEGRRGRVVTVIGSCHH